MQKENTPSCWTEEFGSRNATWDKLCNIATLFYSFLFSLFWVWIEKPSNANSGSDSTGCFSIKTKPQFLLLVQVVFSCILFESEFLRHDVIVLLSSLWNLIRYFQLGLWGVLFRLIHHSGLRLRWRNWVMLLLAHLLHHLLCVCVCVYVPELSRSSITHV